MSFVQQKKLTLFDGINYALLILISLGTLFPFLYVFSVSFTDAEAYVPLEFYFFPKEWSWDAYAYVLSTNSFMNSLKSTLFVTIIGTVLNLIVTFTMALRHDEAGAAGIQTSHLERYFYPRIQCGHIAELFADPRVGTD